MRELDKFHPLVFPPNSEPTTQEEKWEGRWENKIISFSFDRIDMENVIYASGQDRNKTHLSLQILNLNIGLKMVQPWKTESFLTEGTIQ